MVLWRAVAALLLLQATDWQEEGVRALERSDYPAAIEAFRKAVAADPKDYAPLFHLAVAESRAGRDQDAIAHYRATLALEPQLYQANLYLGVLLLRNKQPAEAIPLFEAARQAKPTEPRPVIHLGDSHLATEQWDAAVAAYQAALALDPKSAAAELGLGRALARRGELDAAAPHFETAVQIDPTLKQALLELGERYEQAKRIPEAVAVYRRFPDDPAARERSGQLELAAGRREAAIPDLEAAVRASPTSANRLALATAYLGTKDVAKGTAVLDEALAADPRNFDLRMLAGHAWLDQRQFPKAAREFYQATTLRADSVEAWNEFATSAVLSDNFQAAFAAFDKLKALGAEIPPHWYFRAMMYDKMNQLPQALECYRQFLATSGGKYPNQEFISRQRASIVQRKMSKK